MPRSPQSWAACPGPECFDGVSFSHDPDIPAAPAGAGARPGALPALPAAAPGGAAAARGGAAAGEAEGDRRVASWIADLAEVDVSGGPAAAPRARPRGDPEALRRAARDAGLAGDAAAAAFGGPPSPYTSPSSRRSPGRGATLETFERHGLAARVVAFEASPPGGGRAPRENPFDEAVRASAAAARLAPRNRVIS